jgi:hypothetical protein
MREIFYEMDEIARANKIYDQTCPCVTRDQKPPTLSLTKGGLGLGPLVSKEVDIIFVSTLYCQLPVKDYHTS